MILLSLQKYTTKQIILHFARGIFLNLHFGFGLGTTKEYILVIEGTAPAKEYMYISDITRSIPLRLPNMCLTQPFPALSVVYIL